MRVRISKSFTIAPGILAAVLAIAASACSSPPQDFTVNGTVEIAVQAYHEFQNYSQVVNDTAQVTITDPSGKVIAVTRADNENVKQGPSRIGDMTLTTGFTVKVPAGLSFYGISASGIPGTVHFTEAQMKAGPALCAGNACHRPGR